MGQPEYGNRASGSTRCGVDRWEEYAGRLAQPCWSVPCAIMRIVVVASSDI